MPDNKRNTEPLVFATRQSTRGRRHGLFIGVSTHKNTALNLDYAHKDAETVAGLFTDPEIGGMDTDDAVILLNEEAAGEDIKIELEELVRKADKDDNVVIFFAGHTTIHGGKGYWVPYNGNINYPEDTCISPGELSSKIDRIKAGQTLIFADTCHAATQRLKGNKSRHTGTVSDLRSMLEGKGKLLFASCTDDEKSVESRDKEHGVFTYALLNAIKGKAVPDNKEYLDSDELWPYLQHHVPDLARKEGGKQTPDKSGHETGRLFIARNPLAQERNKKIIGKLARLVAQGELPGKDLDLLREVWLDRGKKDRACDWLYKHLELWDSGRAGFESLKLALDSFKTHEAPIRNKSSKQSKSSARPEPPKSPDLSPKKSGFSIWGPILLISLLAIAVAYWAGTQMTTKQEPFEADQSDLNTKIKGMENELRRVSEQREKLGLENTRITKRLDGVTEERNLLLSENKSLETELAASHEKIQTLGSTISQFEKKTNSLSGQIQDKTRSQHQARPERDHFIDKLTVAGRRLRAIAGKLSNKQVQKKENPSVPEVDKFKDALTGATFVYIKPGRFMMGSPEGEKGRDNDEKLHKVTLTRGFYMQTTEVTQALWKKIMGETPSFFEEGDCPVENVSWDMVQKFISKLNKQSKGHTYRLPTEAQWEYACRAGNPSPYSFGDDEELLVEYAWYGKNSDSTTHPGGELEPNPWGLYDMHGNVWEWCSDGYGTYPLGSVTNPEGDDKAGNRVIRGGSWDGTAEFCRSANRYGNSPGNLNILLGLRLVLLFSGQK